jgi:hypothetical protein
MKRTWRIIGLFFGVFLVSGSISVSKSAGQTNEKVAPFVLETELYSFDDPRHPEPGGVLALRRIDARRSDGSFVLVEIRNGVAARGVRYRDGTFVTIVDDLRKKSTGRAVPPQQMAFFWNGVLRPPANCVLAKDEVWAGSATAYGLQLMIVKQEPSRAANKITSWRTPELGCKNLTYLVETKRGDGSWARVTEQRVVTLKLGEPPPKLFDNGSDYTELKPSVLNRMLLEREGIVADEEILKRDDELVDRDYPKK